MEIYVLLSMVAVMQACPINPAGKLFGTAHPKFTCDQFLSDDDLVTDIYLKSDGVINLDCSPTSVQVLKQMGFNCNGCKCKDLPVTQPESSTTTTGCTKDADCAQFAKGCKDGAFCLGSGFNECASLCPLATTEAPPSTPFTGATTKATVNAAVAKKFTPRTGTAKTSTANAETDTAEAAGNDSKSGSAPLAMAIVSTCVVSVMAVALAVMVFVLIRKNAKAKEQHNVDTVSTLLSESPPFEVVPVGRAFMIPFAQLTLGTVLAAGGQGVVRRGEFGGRPVAVKEVLATMFDPTATQTLQDEASMMCSLHHPNIVRFYGMAVNTRPERGASYYLVTDLKSQDLRDLVNTSSQPPAAEVLRMATQICEALTFLHSKSMVHRDLKPENILLDDHLTVFLCDFGLSKAYQSNDRVDMTVNLGTAAYMAPELAQLCQFAREYSRDSAEIALGEANDSAALASKNKIDSAHLSTHIPPIAPENRYDAVEGEGGSNTRLCTDAGRACKLDCYSFALVLWALLSWKLPFRDAPPIQILVAAAFQHQRPSVKDLVETWPSRLLKLMRDMWHADPDARPSAAEATRVLQRCTEEGKNLGEVSTLHLCSENLDHIIDVKPENVESDDVIDQIEDGGSLDDTRDA